MLLRLKIFATEKQIKISADYLSWKQSGIRENTNFLAQALPDKLKIKVLDSFQYPLEGHEYLHVVNIRLEAEK